MARRSLVVATVLALDLAAAFQVPATFACRMVQPVAARTHAPLAIGDGKFKLPTLELPFGGSKKEEKAVAEGQPVAAKDEKDKEEEGMTLEKIASFGIAGVLSIAVAETVFWVLSFPTSELVYFVATGEWIDLFTQEGQLKFLAFTAGWGAIGGVIAQYRTVLTAAAMTPWMDANVVKPYVNPLIERFGGESK